MNSRLLVDVLEDFVHPTRHGGQDVRFDVEDQVGKAEAFAAFAVFGRSGSSRNISSRPAPLPLPKVLRMIDAGASRLVARPNNFFYPTWVYA